MYIHHTHAGFDLNFFILDRDLKFRLEKKENIPMNSIVVASCYFIASAVGCIFGLQFSHLMQEHVPGSLSRDPIN